nr:zinc finger, CCHC-type [Tanacetum cinerariifolium]
MFNAKGDDGEGLYVRGRTDRRDSSQSRGKSRSKYRGERLKCYIFQSEDHLKRNCLKNNRKKSTSYVKKDKQPSSSGSIYDDFEVMMVMTAQALQYWIMDSRCSYHMTPRLDILFDFLKCDGGSVQLGDNREGKIRGLLEDITSEITHEVLNAAAGGIFLYKTPNQTYQLLEDKVLLKFDWAKNQKTISSLKKTVAFTEEGKSNSDTDKIMARMDSMTIKMNAQYKALQSRAKQ